MPRRQSSRGALALFLQTNPSSLDYADDLAALVSLNECSAMNTLQQRYRARLPYTYAGPSLVAIRPSFPASSSSGKVSGVGWVERPWGGRDLPWEAVTDPGGDSGGGRRALWCRQMAPWDHHSARPGHAGGCSGRGML